MQLRYLNLPWLIEAAGGDPWQVNNTLQSGNPGVVDELAQAFHNAALCTSDSSEAFTEARKRFRAAWNRENGEHPINDSLEVQRATQTLHLQQTQLVAIGTDLENIAAALAEAQSCAADKIAALETQLQNIDDHIGVYLDADVDVSDLVQVAVDDTGGILHQIEKVRADYAATLQAATAKLLSDGYDPVALHGYDGDGQPTLDQQTDRAADAYGTTQRDQDQELVNEPGEMTQEKADAAARLRDYATVTDPAADPDARRLAGERLGDFRMTNFVGPLPMDGTLGGDARTRAQARLEIQKGLERGTLDGRTFTPDQATWLLDAAEQEARVRVTREAIDALVREAGMSRPGATQFVGDVARGRAGHILRDGAESLGTSTGAGESALGGFAETFPRGRHNLPGVTYSAEDVAAIRGLSKRMGVAGDVLGAGVAVYDVLIDHKPLTEVVATNAGGLGGGLVGSEIGAVVGAPLGPAGVLIGAFAFGVVGSIYGERAVESVLELAKN